MKIAGGLACVSGTTLILSLSTAVEVAQLSAAVISAIAGVGSIALLVYNWKKAYDNAKAPKRKARRK